MIRASGDEHRAPSYQRILRQAWPAILANAAVPLMGMVDTAIIARVGHAVDLAGVALSTLVFNAVYWALGFLRMSTTALVAQARGQGDDVAVCKVVLRALLLASVLGLLLILTRHGIAELCLAALAPGPEVRQRALDYISVRFWGAPAVLVHSAVCGGLIGLGSTRLLLRLQVLMNLVNVGCSFFFVWGVGGAYAGVRGIAAGSAAAEWVVALAGVWGAARAAKPVLPQVMAETPLQWLADGVGWRSVLSINANIFVRTVSLLAGFAWFTRSGSQLGELTLAANHLLQQVMSFSAFFLDGIAFVTESHVGQSIGAQDNVWFRRAVWRTSVVAFAFGLALAAVVLGFGPWLVASLSPSRDVAAIAETFLPLSALYVLVGVVPWQLDGVFIGAARGAALRNAAIVSSLVFVGTATWWTRTAGNWGLWWAMLLYIALRGVTLGLHFRSVTRLFSDAANGKRPLSA